MEEFTLTCAALSHTVKEILTCFVEQWEIFRKAKYNHIDVTLIKSEGNYIVLLSNYGQIEFEINDFTRRGFRHLIGTCPFKRNIPLAFVRKKNCKDEENYTVHLARNSVKAERNAKNVIIANSAVWRNYLSLQLKHKLSVADFGQFKDDVSKRLILLGERTTNIKYTFRCENRMIYSNRVQLDNDVETCEILRDALVNIIKQSVNIEFTEACFRLLNVKNSHEAKKIIMAKVLPLIHDNYVFPDVRYYTHKEK